MPVVAAVERQVGGLELSDASGSLSLNFSLPTTLIGGFALVLGDRDFTSTGCRPLRCWIDAHVVVPAQ
jgi:hypothetical protein